LVGLCAIGYSVSFFRNTMPFPGVRALVPCLGAASIIAAGKSRFVGRALGSPPFAVVGRWSFAIYLVHWPLLTFYRQRHGEALQAVDRVTLIGATLVLAAALHFGIEERFRRPQKTDVS